MVGKALANTLGSLRKSGSLGQRAVGSAMWHLAGQGGRVAMRLAANLILTRLLVPEAFGLMALVFTVHAGLQMLSDIGLKPSVIRHPKGDDPVFLRTVWCLQIIKFTILALILAAISLSVGAVQWVGWADFGDTVYGDPDLPFVMAATGALLILRGLRTTNIELAQRNLQMRVVIPIELASGVIGYSAMIGIALVWPSVWALVIGTAIGSICGVILGHIFIPGPRMAFQIDRTYLKEIWTFGRWLIGASALSFLATRGDRFILGAFLDRETFGLYAVAFIWIEASIEIIKRVMNNTNLSVLSEVGRDNEDRMRGIFRKIRMVQDGVVFLAGCFFLFLGGTFAMIFYDGKFEAVGLLLPILSLRIFMARYEIFGSLLLRGGDSKSIAAVTLVRAVVFNALLLLAVVTLAWPLPLIVVGSLGAIGLGMLLRRANAHVPINFVSEYTQLIVIYLAFLATYFLVLAP